VRPRASTVQRRSVFANAPSHHLAPSIHQETILVGLRSFRVDDEVQAGGIKSDAATLKRFAAESRAFNRKDKNFLALFGEQFNFGVI